MNQELLTVREVAAILRMSTDAVYRRFREGALPSTIIGRRRLVRRSDLDAYIARRFERETAS